jgi:acylphosphatase
VLIVGRVQGVGFRYTAAREARRLGLTGLVRNRPDGCVEVTAEGDRASLELFLRWLRRGPAGAHVREAQVDWVPGTGAYSGFDVES